MIILALIFGAILVWQFIYKPFAEAQDVKAAYEYIQDLRNFQAFAVLKYHSACRESPRLRELTIKEIREGYNLTDCYNKIR